jgi:hypothetical protein
LISIKGIVAGALNESFSNESQLKIWAPDFLDKNKYNLGGEGHAGPKNIVAGNSRCKLDFVITYLPHPQTKP